ncbi:Dabb family protein [Aliiroseovarius sp. KMU-50]|uniref:Dabb family protein n=1 Tax=Aliiroseovarius salicola TaxID=3009082 RepID=A0ABT4W3W8_9RHOB|nr:Dabb family protein [Aliiroseovarius sp. KMU-50]MDA5095199.1 Dabb family protein [Aliiroseovarius sp. KMU-50]
MIRHVVFFTARNPNDRDMIFDGLNLLQGIPHKRFLEVGCNLATDPIPGTHPDFVVYGEFDDEAQLIAFKDHPLYQESIKKVRPLRDLRMSADFLSGQGN